MRPIGFVRVFALTAGPVALCSAPAGWNEAAGQSFFSARGMVSGSAGVQDEFFFTLDNPGGMTFRTFAHSGGTNAGGALVPAGGIDALLTLRTAAGTTIVSDDDSGPGFDALITRSLAAGPYRLAQTVFPGGQGDGRTAVDIVNNAPGDLTLTVISNLGGLSETAQLDFGATGNATATLRILEGVDIVVTDRTTIASGGVLLFDGGTSFSTRGTLQSDTLINNGSIIYRGGELACPTFENNGTLLIYQGATLELNHGISGVGAVVLDRATLSFDPFEDDTIVSGNIQGTGSLESEAGAVTFTGTYEVDGFMSTDGLGTEFYFEGPVLNAGDVFVGADGHIFFNDRVDAVGRIEGSQGVVEFNGPLNATIPEIDTTQVRVDFNTGAAVTIGQARVEGTDGDTDFMDGINGTDDITVIGDLRLTFGPFVGGSGTLYTNGGAFIDSIALTRTLHNPAGRTIVYDGNDAFTGFELYSTGAVDNFGIFDDQGGRLVHVDVSRGVLTGGPGHLNNHGVYRKLGRTTLVEGVVFDNTGVVEVIAGELVLNSGGTHTGRFDIAAGGILEFGEPDPTPDPTVPDLPGGVHVFTGSSVIAGGGTLRLSGGENHLAGTIDVARAEVTGGRNFFETPDALAFLGLGGGDTTFTTSQAIGTMVLTGGTNTISAGRTLTLSGLVAAPGGNLTMAPSAGATPAARLLLSGDVLFRDVADVASITTGTALNSGAFAPPQAGGVVDLGGLALPGDADGARTFDVDDLPRIPGPELTINARVTNGRLAKTGAGTMRLAGPTDFTGGLVVDGGVLEVTTTASFGGGVRVGTRGTLAGTLAVAADDRLGVPANAVTLAGGTLRTTQSFSTSRTFTLGDTGGNGNGVLDVPSALHALTLNTAPGGLAGLVKTGDGTVVLQAGAASPGAGYRGATRVQRGTLRLGPAGAINPLSNVTINTSAALDVTGTATRTLGSLAGDTSVVPAGGTLLLNGGEVIVGVNGATTSFGGTVSGPGSFAKEGLGTLTLHGRVNIGGALNVRGGTLALNRQVGSGNTMIGNGATISGAGSTLAVATDADLGPSANGVTLASGGTLRSTAGSSTSTRRVTAGTGGGAIDIAQAATTLTFSGTLDGSGTLAKRGPGRLNLRVSAPSFTGALAVGQEPMTPGATRGVFSIGGGLGRLPGVASVRVGPAGLLEVDELGSDLDRLRDTAPITLDAGELRYSGFSTPTAEQFGALNVLGGTSFLTLSGAGGTLTFPSIGAVPRGSLLTIQPTGGDLGEEFRIFLGTGALPTGGRVFVGTASGTVAAEYQAGFGIVPRGFIPPPNLTVPEPAGGAAAAVAGLLLASGRRAARRRRSRGATSGETFGDAPHAGDAPCRHDTEVARG